MENLYKGFISEDIPLKGIRWRDASENCFHIYGLHMESVYQAGKAVYERLPQDITSSFVSKEMPVLARHTAGARIRFQSDSEYVAIRVLWEKYYELSHMPGNSQCGFDLYLTEDGKSRYYKSFVPPRYVWRREKGYEAVIHFGTRKMRDVTIYFPIANQVDDLKIGMEETSRVYESTGYRLEKPVVYYGSSITHGACASRPGNTYEGFVSRALDLDQRNLGFSDSARGDRVMAEYIASLDMSAFVFDYDHNAPNVEWLLHTHYPFYEVVREAHPNIPIICMSKPKPRFDDIPEPGEQEYIDIERKNIIFETVKKAREAGDNQIYFVDGETLYGKECSGECTVDGSHPNDLGFYRMAQALIPVLKEALKIENMKV